MARRPAKSIWGGSGAKPGKPAVMRNRAYEALLCQAVEQRVQVELQYDRTAGLRVFEPDCVYTSTQDKVCVSGIQASNSAEPLNGRKPHNFEVGRIKNLRVTDVNFQPNPLFDSRDPKYKNGFICKR